MQSTKEPLTSQTLHDIVVRWLAAHATGYLVHTNLRRSQPGVFIGVGWHEFQEASPDVLLCDPELFAVQHVVEVETEDTVTPDRVERWRQIVRATRGQQQCDFWILVPFPVAENAGRLCRIYGIPAHVGTWAVTPQETVQIQWSRPRRVVAPTAPPQQKAVQATTSP